MESIWRHVLKGVFDEFMSGLDDNIEFSNSMVKLWDLKLKEDKVHEVFAEAYTSPVEFTAGTIGSGSALLSRRADHQEKCKFHLKVHVL